MNPDLTIVKHKRFCCKGGVAEALCPVCGKELPTKGALEMHMKNHAKEKGQDFSLAGKGEERQGWVREGVATEG